MSKPLASVSSAPLERLSTLIEDMFPASRLPKILWNPAVDIGESDNQYTFQVELPGLSREDLEVEFTGNTLVIRGSRHEEAEEEGECYLRRERQTGSFFRSFRIDTPVKANEVAADYRNGLLTVTVPKAEQVKAQKITIK